MSYPCDASTTTPPPKGGTLFLLAFIIYKSTIFVSGSGIPHKNFVNLLLAGNNCLTFGLFKYESTVAKSFS